MERTHINYANHAIECVAFQLCGISTMVLLMASHAPPGDFELGKTT